MTLEHLKQGLFNEYEYWNGESSTWKNTTKEKYWRDLGMLLICWNAAEKLIENE